MPDSIIPFRFFGSSTPDGTPPVQYAPTGGPLLCLFPFEGEQVNSFVTGLDYYPFLLPLELGSMPAGGKAVKWWDRVLTWQAQVSWSLTLEYFEDFEHKSESLSGNHTFFMHRNPFWIGAPSFDERDVMRPGYFEWIGVFNPEVEGATGAFTSLRMSIMPSLPLFAFDGLTAFPGPRYYVVNEEAVAPLFVLSGQIGKRDEGFLWGEFAVTSYTRNTNDGSGDYPGGSKGMGTGTLDGESFKLYARADNPDTADAENPGDLGSSVNSLTVNITPYAYASHGGTWDTGSGALLRPTNDFVD